MAKKTAAANLAFMGMMTALVFVSNYISIPTGYSRLHAANAVCLLAGMLFGGVRGEIIAGLGSAIFDLTFPAYAPEFWITTGRPLILANAPALMVLLPVSTCWAVLPAVVPVSVMSLCTWVPPR